MTSLPPVKDVDSSSDDDDAVYRHYYRQFNTAFKKLFTWLDRPFMKLNSLEDQIFTYSACDMALGSRLELPIVVPLPGDTISFDFSFSESGEVSLGVYQFADVEVDEDEEMEEKAVKAEAEAEAEKDSRRMITLLDAKQYTKDETISGNLELENDGVVLFVFENDEFDWLGRNIGKSLSYNIQVTSRTFTFEDEERNVLARQILNDLLSDNEITKRRLDSVDNLIDETETAADTLEEALTSARSELVLLKGKYASQLEIAKNETYRLEHLYERFNGLFYRGMTTTVLKRVLSFLPKAQCVCVCKSWLQLLSSPRLGGTMSSKSSVRHQERRVVDHSHDGVNVSNNSSANDQIEMIETEKQKIKNLMKEWENRFSHQHGRKPTDTEFRNFGKGLFERYAELSFQQKKIVKPL